MNNKFLAILVGMILCSVGCKPATSPAVEKTEICTYVSGNADGAVMHFEFKCPDGKILRVRYADRYTYPDSAKHNPKMDNVYGILRPLDYESAPPDFDTIYIGKPFEIVTKGDTVLSVRGLEMGEEQAD